MIDAILSTYEDDNNEYRMDTVWYNLQNMRCPVGSNYRFCTLFKVAKLVLVTPLSNADIERVYSLVNRNKGEESERNRMDIDSYLSSILAAKLDRPESFCKCYKYTSNETLMKKAKKPRKNTMMLTLQKNISHNLVSEQLN